MSGSVALAMQSVPLECRDLDLVTTAQAAEEVLHRIGGTVLEEVSFRQRGHIQGEMGRTELDGIDVDVLGGVQNLLPDGTWSAPPRLDMCVVHVPLGNDMYPVIALPYLQEVYAAMGRFDKVSLIKSVRLTHQ